MPGVEADFGEERGCVVNLDLDEAGLHRDGFGGALRRRAAGDAVTSGAIVQSAGFAAGREQFEAFPGPRLACIKRRQGVAPMGRHRDVCLRDASCGLLGVLRGVVETESPTGDILAWGIGIACSYGDLGGFAQGEAFHVVPLVIRGGLVAQLDVIVFAERLHL